ncbi:MAG: deoxyribose-phosphate aldolase [Thermoleophilia bacterium]|nr:deoxyribose-phosphate aldolase [Thermoleophilia bacterium]
MTGISIAKSLELHLLQPLVTRDEVRAGCLRAADAHLASVCVWPAHVALAASTLAGRDTRVRAAIGFPYGQETASVKLAACDRALADGAHELAVMLDHSALAPGGDPAAARVELDQVLQHAWWSALNAARGRAELTVVLETTMLDLRELAPVFERLHDTPAGFLQTGSGHQPRAVTEQHVRALRELLPADIAIVAVGGVAQYDDAEALVTAGAVRVGSGSAIAIIDQERHAREVRQITP